MRSFSQIAALAVVAFVGLAAAAPVAAPKRQLKSLPTILDELRSNMVPVTDGLNSLTADTATPATLTAFAQQMSDVVSPAVTQISALAGSPVGTILATSDGVLTPTQAAQHLAPVLTAVYGAVNQVSALTSSTGAASTVQPQLNTIAGALDPLLGAVAPLVNGLLAALGPILGPISSTGGGFGFGPALGIVDGVI
ncbi:hypothetical protein GGX14DRAFT_573088 [Mycena pura]|uniref:Uncharacterized protein n=1 Tax=Mycena pura TaxID=153505 RepID=A0AAD6V756_9AGAR|nr:hypothetical protein GGX14DRAFT_573088 [Mycena pura]